MRQIAVFVDAGYLYAQGSALMAGQKQPRATIELNVDSLLRELIGLALEVEPDGRLLRIYWYDGILRGGQLTAEQTQIAHSPNVKLRLGMINSRGQQKGVDSLIVTDLIDLARNSAISDALIVSGDEDIRIGVQVAQTFGVRTHLLGIKPARGSQSPDLIQEADTHHEWSAEGVGRWLVVRAEPPPAALPTAPVPGTQTAVLADVVNSVVEDVLKDLDELRLKQAVDHLAANRERIPPELDRPSLGTLRLRLGRDLTDDERRIYRTIFAQQLRDRASTRPRS